MTLTLLLPGSHTHDWLIDTQCLLAAGPVLGMGLQKQSRLIPAWVLDEDWVLGRAHPPEAPEGRVPTSTWLGPLENQEAPGLSRKEYMQDLEKEFIVHISSPGLGTWVRLLASFTPLPLQTEELLLRSLSLFLPLSNGAENSTCLVWWYRWNEQTQPKR